MKYLALAVMLVLFVNSGNTEVVVEKPFFDPFRKLIEPPKKKIVKQRRTVVREKKKEKIVIPPLQMNVMGISGEEGNRVAIVSYKGQQRLLMEGDQQPGEFKVISIDENKITLLHIKAGTRQVVKF
jgi:hypothetical protein